MLMQLGLTGLVAAVLPLALVWVSNDSNKYRKLAWITVFLTFDLIMFGAFTRLTDSGLGCPDWPGCYGQANPFQAHTEITAAQAQMPTGPVTPVKAWIEMIHRYLAMVIGVLIIALMLAAWHCWLKSHRSKRRFSPLLPTSLFLFVCLQGAFGAWTVTQKLQPIIVTTHLLLGMCLLALTGALAMRHDPEPKQTEITETAARKIGLLTQAAGVFLLAQIALGGWVSTNYAALACSDFPLCQGSMVPSMDFANGFTLWRALGKTAGGEFLPFPALTAIHWVHRGFAFTVLAVLGCLTFQALKFRHLNRSARWLAIILLLQFASGIGNVLLEWPLALAVIHNGGAALLILLLTVLHCKIGRSANFVSPTAMLATKSHTTTLGREPDIQT